MSRNLSAAAIASFDSLVKHDYQAMGQLRKTVRVKTGVKGSTHRFQRMGKGMATARIPQTDVIPMNVGHEPVNATLSDWNAPEYTDIFDQAKTNVNERKELAETIAGAITRREDQLLIDALDAATTTKKVAVSVGGANSGLNTAKVREAKRLLDKSSVPKTDRFMVVHSNALSQMLDDPKATSSDFNTVKALVDGNLKTWLGFNWIQLGDYDEGGLDLTGKIRTNFAYQKKAMGLAVGIDFRTEVGYVREKTSWLANGLFSAGAVAIDPDGIVELSTYENF